MGDGSTLFVYHDGVTFRVARVNLETGEPELSIMNVRSTDPIRAAKKYRIVVPAGLVV